MNKTLPAGLMGGQRDFAVRPNPGRFANRPYRDVGCCWEAGFPDATCSPYPPYQGTVHAGAGMTNWEGAGVTALAGVTGTGGSDGIHQSRIAVRVMVS